jgi:hypothetical protein
MCLIFVGDVASPTNIDGIWKPVTPFSPFSTCALVFSFTDFFPNPMLPPPPPLLAPLYAA